MAASYKTPGVYIEEISKFPPSIAAVETAIPAFIGYTQRDTYNGKSLKGMPVRVEAMIEFEEIFGFGPPLDITSVELTPVNTVKSVDIASSYYLYDSLRMYFRNGGGKCYIVSLGVYPSVFADAAFVTEVGNALGALRKEDEPTLILFPDGVKLPASSLGNLQKQVLMECENLKDRFMVADVKISDPSNEKYDKTDIDNFRTGIGMGSLKYGAAYYPYLKVDLPREIHYRDIKDKVKKLGVVVNWKTDFIEATDTDTKTLFDELSNVIDSNKHLVSVMATFLGTEASIEEMYLKKKAAFYNAVSVTPPVLADVKTAYQDLWDFLYSILEKFVDKPISGTTPPLKGTLLTETKTSVDTILSSTPNSLTDLFIVDNLSQETVLLDPAFTNVFHSLNTRTFTYGNINTSPNGITAIMAAAPDSTGLTLQSTPTTDVKRIANLKEVVQKKADIIFNGLYRLVTKIYQDGLEKEKASEVEIIRRIPTLASVIRFIASDSFLLPPSGAIAGVYARVDFNRGVWKAPANETLNGVVAPSVKIETSQNDELNVDVNYGKSINVIRSFTGKGPLVWGARTLAGNDNEWRYVSVRRLFNMVEESTRKASEQFVFEPNDANTWVRVQAMIENFLTTLWKAGALQGAKREHAFYVAVGLGKTMTALDILEGRMIVEIGMAAVRPAEFIILRFSHKMAES